MGGCRAVGAEYRTEVAVKGSIEGGRYLPFVVLWEEDPCAVCCRAPEHRRVDCAGPRERTAPRLAGESRESVALRGQPAPDLAEVFREE